MLTNKRIDGGLIQERKNFDPVFGISITRIQPELVKLVGMFSGSNHTLPCSVFATCHRFLISGQVNANASLCALRRINSVPVVILPHWSLPPICSLQLYSLKDDKNQSPASVDRQILYS